MQSKIIKTVLFVAIGITNILQAQNKDNVLIDFGDDKVTKEEFKRVYQKNNSGEMVSKSTVEEYLELYINFKLKVKEAEARGLDTVSSFVNELEGYRNQLAQPYLSADAVLEELKKEAYERLQYDVRASHILISVAEDAGPEDTLKAFKKISELRKRVIKGEDFSKVAKEHSDDPSAKANGGDLGYFTAFYMVYPFETAAYETEVGGISKIIRSRFGYHILHVADKRKAVGNMSVAHILISSDPELSKTDDPEGKINEIYKKLTEEDVTFEDMAAQFSDDTRTASKGGLLQTFGVGRMVPEFEEEVLKLKADNEISKPFQTQFGWHIIKRIKIYEIASFKEIEEELTQRVKKDSRSNLTEGVVIKKIKDQYGFKENIKERNDFYAVIDTSYFNENWDVKKASSLTKTMFSIGDKKVTQKDFANYLGLKQVKKEPIDERVLINKNYETFKNEHILKYKDSKLDNEYPEFASLMEEYHDGILLFNLTDELVWGKAVKDTSGLKEFFENNKSAYKWEERVDGTVYNALSEKIIESVKELIKQGKTEREIIKEANKQSQLNLKFEQRKFQKGDHEIVDQVEWVKGFSKTIQIANRYYFVHIKAVLEPEPKTLDDSRGMITSDYQEHLEKEWISSLRTKYNFNVNSKVLEELKTELK